MQTGAITGYIDVAQLALYAFWIFFAGLIYYLHRENKREGYPLVDHRYDGKEIAVEGFPFVPEPKTYVLNFGHGTIQAPRGERDRDDLAAAPVAPWPGAPLDPTGDPMVAAVGPGAYTQRGDVPEMTWDNEPLIGPMRVVAGTSVDPEDPDPRGMEVVGCDGVVGGTVTELWIDRAEPQIRYLELAVADGGKKVLLPMGFADINRSARRVYVNSIRGAQFANVPTTKSDEVVTKLEEDMITAYYGGGILYATPARREPLL